MPKKYKKYLNRLPKHWREKLDETVGRIAILDLDRLDIKKLSGFETLFRCRVGKFRIVFEKRGVFGEILEINTRCDIY